MLITYYLSINIDYTVYHNNLKINNIESAKTTCLKFENDLVSVICLKMRFAYEEIIAVLTNYYNNNYIIIQ